MDILLCLIAIGILLYVIKGFRWQGTFSKINLPTSVANLQSNSAVGQLGILLVQATAIFFIFLGRVIKEAIILGIKKSKP